MLSNSSGELVRVNFLGAARGSGRVNVKSDCMGLFLNTYYNNMVGYLVQKLVYLVVIFNFVMKDPASMPEEEE